MEREPEFPFWYQERVRFRDVDLQQIVYYGKYLDYVDNAFYEYLRHLGFSTHDLKGRYAFDTAVLRMEFDYISSAHFDDLLDIGVRVTRLGRSSFDASYEVRNDQGVVCRATLMLVNYDAEAARARPIPEPIRTAIEHSSGIASEAGREEW
jgi:acyl-CoA thioester hydrolase